MGRIIAIGVGAVVVAFIVFIIVDVVYTFTGAFIAAIFVFALIAGVVGYLDRREQESWTDD